MTEEITLHENAPLFRAMNNPEVIRRFELACGAKAGSVMTNIMNAANANPAILECEPTSVITAGLNASAMGLSLSPSLGQATILPFDNSVRNPDGSWGKVKKAQLIVMARGVRDMAMRTNKYRVLNAFEVYEGQEVITDQMTGKMSIAGRRVNDNVIGYGAYLQLFSGFEAAVYWTIEQLTAHAKRYSKTYDQQRQEFRKNSQWVTDFDRMARKTVLKDLIMNHGVIDDNARAMLEAADIALMPEAQPEAVSFADAAAEVIDAPIDEAEARYKDALEVTTPKGSRLADLNHEQLLACTLSKNEQIASAAKIILDYRAALNGKGKDAIDELFPQ